MARTPGPQRQIGPDPGPWAPARTPDYEAFLGVWGAHDVGSRLSGLCLRVFLRSSTRLLKIPPPKKLQKQNLSGSRLKSQLCPVARLYALKLLAGTELTIKQCLHDFSDLFMIWLIIVFVGVPKKSTKRTGRQCESSPRTLGSRRNSKRFAVEPRRRLLAPSR